MVERAERQDPEPGFGPDQRRCSRADRAVASADHHQLIAALGKHAASHCAVATADQLDLGVDAGLLKRLGDLVADLRVSGDGTAPAI